MTPSEELKQELKKFKLRKTPVFLSCKNVDYIFQSKIVQIEQDNLLLLNSVPPHLIKQVVEQEHYVIHIGSIFLESKSISSNGEQIIFPIGQRKTAPDTRSEERFNFVTRSDASCNILNPYDNRTVLSKSIIGLSTSGISIRSSLRSKLFYPGLEIQKLDIIVSGSLLESRQGKVVYKKRVISEDFDEFSQVGIKFNTPLEKV